MPSASFTTTTTLNARSRRRFRAAEANVIGTVVYIRPEPKFRAEMHVLQPPLNLSNRFIVAKSGRLPDVEFAHDVHQSTAFLENRRRRRRSGGVVAHQRIG